MIKTLLFILSLAFLFSCDKYDRVNFAKIESYPTKTGTEWNYSSVSVLKIFESASLEKVIDYDTLIFNIKVKIEKDTLLNDTMLVKQFSSKAEEADFTSMEYFFVDSEGLKAYAYSNPTLHVFVKKHSFTYRKLNLLSPGLYDPEPLTIEEDDLHVYQPFPRLNLKLPLELNSKWTYVNTYAPMHLQIDKEIIGQEVVKINNTSYNCYKIQWIYIDNVFFDGIKIYDWISNKGLIKRQAIYEPTLFSAGEEELIGYGQVTETITLKDLNF